MIPTKSQIKVRNFIAKECRKEIIKEELTKNEINIKVEITIKKMIMKSMCHLTTIQKTMVTSTCNLNMKLRVTMMPTTINKKSNHCTIDKAGIIAGKTQLAKECLNMNGNNKKILRMSNLGNRKIVLIMKTNGPLNLGKTGCIRKL